MEKLASVALHSVVAFITLFIISKILGKKQVAQLEFIDYVIGISIGSMAADMAFQSDVPYFHYILAIFIFGGLDLIITLASRKTLFFKKMFKGRPLILIADGKIVYENLVKSKLDVDELVSQCRAKGYFNVDDIAYCIFETSGDFSILPHSQSRQVVAEDLNLPNQVVGLILEIIIDGRIIKKDLQKTGKDVDWLLSKLAIEDKKDLKNILLATYDPATNKLSVQTKTARKK